VALMTMGRVRYHVRAIRLSTLLSYQPSETT
jgi:hypothetical protein